MDDLKKAATQYVTQKASEIAMTVLKATITYVVSDVKEKVNNTLDNMKEKMDNFDKSLKGHEKNTKYEGKGGGDTKGGFEFSIRKLYIIKKDKELSENERNVNWYVNQKEKSH